MMQIFQGKQIKCEMLGKITEVKVKISSTRMHYYVCFNYNSSLYVKLNSIQSYIEYFLMW